MYYFFEMICKICAPLHRSDRKKIQQNISKLFRIVLKIILQNSPFFIIFLHHHFHRHFSSSFFITIFTTIFHHHFSSLFFIITICHRHFYHIFITTFHHHFASPFPSFFIISIILCRVFTEVISFV